jgi:hypothetical protein
VNTIAGAPVTRNEARPDSALMIDIPLVCNGFALAMNTEHSGRRNRRCLASVASHAFGTLPCVLDLGGPGRWRCDEQCCRVQGVHTERNGLLAGVLAQLNESGDIHRVLQRTLAIIVPALRCDVGELGQGFGLGKPTAADDVEDVAKALRDRAALSGLRPRSSYLFDDE